VIEQPNDEAEEPLNDKNSPERLVFFTDAVVAIALTLLVLPLTDIVPELVAAHGSSIEAITDHQWQIRSFLLSFLVVGRQWMSHHHLFTHVARYNTTLFVTNMVWLLTVVVLPFPTEMVGGFGADRFTCLFYLGTMVANSGCLTALTAVVRRNPELTGDRGEVSDRRWFDAVGSTVALAAAFVVAAVVPGVGYFAILLLLVPNIVARLTRSARVARSWS
jgi:uncharacterized membrane protein